MVLLKDMFLLLILDRDSLTREEFQIGKYHQSVLVLISNKNKSVVISYFCYNFLTKHFWVYVYMTFFLYFYSLWICRHHYAERNCICKPFKICFLHVLRFGNSSLIKKRKRKEQIVLTFVYKNKLNGSRIHERFWLHSCLSISKWHLFQIINFLKELINENLSISKIGFLPFGKKK